MARVDLDVADERELRRLIATHGDVPTVSRRYILLEDAGLRRFETRVNVESNAADFSAELVRVLQDFGTLEDTGQPALVSLLRVLRERVEGHAAERAFVDGLLAPYPAASDSRQYGDETDSADWGLSSLTKRKHGDLSNYRIPCARELIGRERELHQLHQVYGEILEAGHGQIVILHAPRGYGKFALAHRFLEERLSANGVVLATGFNPPPPAPDGDNFNVAPRAWPAAIEGVGTAWYDLMIQGQRFVDREHFRSFEESDAPEVLIGLLRRVCHGNRPCVMFLDEVDRASKSWETLLLILSIEMGADLPILLLTTLESNQVLSDIQALVEHRIPLQTIALPTLGTDDVVRHLTAKMGGPVSPPLAWALHDRADGIPAWVEDILSEWMSAEVPAGSGETVSALRRDESDQWCAAPEAADLVFKKSWDLARRQLEHALFGGHDGDAHDDDAESLRDAMKILGYAALEGPTFTIEVVAYALGGDDPDGVHELANDLIDWIDEDLIPNDPAQIVIEVDNPIVGNRPLHRYRFSSRRIWAAWRKYGLGKLELHGALVRIAEAVEALWLGPQAETKRIAEHVDVLADLFRDAAGVECPTDAPREAAEWRERQVRWLELANWYDQERRIPDSLAGLAWQARVMSTAGWHHTQYDQRVWCETLIALTDGILDAVAHRDCTGVPTREQQRAAFTDVGTEGALHAAALDAVEHAARAVEVAKTLRDQRLLARALQWERMALVVAEIVRRDWSDPTLERVAELVTACAGAAAVAADFAWAATPDGARDLLAPMVRAIMEDAGVDQSTRISAGLLLGRLGDPRFERRDGPHGLYVDPPMIAIEAGEYPIGSKRDDPDADPDEFDEHPVVLAAFEIGQYPVTNAEYACFIEAGGYNDDTWWDTEAARRWLHGDPEQAEVSRSYWRELRRRWQAEPGFRDTWVRGGIADEDLDTDRGVFERRRITELTERRFEVQITTWYPGTPVTEPYLWAHPEYGNPAQPVIGVSWYEARAYCAWLSAQTHRCFALPSEPQWEAAARGVGGRRFPFGEAFEKGVANVANARVFSTSPVGAFPKGATPEGIHDLCGNVWEWTRSLYDRGDRIPRAYPYMPGDASREDQAAPGNWRRVVRGGSWYYVYRYARAASRFRSYPGSRLNYVGFRVVRAAPIS